LATAFYRLDATDGEFIIDGSFSNETSVLSLNLDVNEGADGIAARLLDIPGRPALDLTVVGEGEIATFGADIALATDGADRVAGQFARTNDDGLQGFNLDIGGDITPLLEPAYHDFFGNDLSLVVAGRQLPDGRFDLSALDLTARRLNVTGGALIGAEGWPERFNLNGTIGDDFGGVVLLPLTGPQTFVDRVTLDIAFDQAISDGRPTASKPSQSGLINLPSAARG